MNTLDLQNRLYARGYDPGPRDGIIGRRTIAAVKAFQAAEHLAVDGIVGPRTAAALLADPGDPRPPVAASALTPPWYDLMDSYRRAGIDEVGDRATIADWASELGIRDFDARATPWCGLAVAHCIAATLAEEPLPNNPLGARNFLSFGRACAPQRAAVLVFWRGARTGWSGHVGLYAGEDAAAYHVLGGNQGNAVTIARIGRDRLLAARWPATAPFLATGRVDSAGVGALSKDEA